MKRSKRIILVGIGIGLLVISAIFLITQSLITKHEEYVNSLEEKEVSILTLNSGDILIIQSEGIEDAISIVKIYDTDDNLIASSQSELDEGVSLIFTAEESGDYQIVALLDNPETEVDGTITLSVSHYITTYLILLGALFVFASILVIASSLMRERYIIPSGTMVDKMKTKAMKPEKSEIQKPVGITKEALISKYKDQIEPANTEIIMSFLAKIYQGIINRSEVLDAYAIDLTSEEIVWTLSDQKGKSDLSFLEAPVPLESNKGIQTIFNKIFNLYGGSLPPQIVLSFPNYYLNALVHKQIMVMVLLEPEVDWGISSSIFKK